MITGFAKKIFTSTKNLTIFFTPGWLAGFMAGPVKGSANLVFFKEWMKRHASSLEYNDYFSIKRKYANRYNLYEYVSDKYHLDSTPITYLEFGVSVGSSFKWWLEKNKASDSEFYGFDTFEGLPESWGTYKKGAMISDIPEVNDQRAHFIKGLFQDTLYDFVDNHSLNSQRTVFHLDADLFTASVFVLTTMHRYMKAGDLIIFDEFNVPNHEFEAFRIFESSFNFKYKVIGAVNNYLQVVLEVL